MSEDTASFDVFFQTHYLRARRSAFLLVKDWLVADELTQEAFIKAFRKWDDLNSLIDNRSAWLYTVTKNLALDYLRQQGRRQKRASSIIDSTPPSADSPEGKITNRIIIVKALNKLPPQQRSCIIRRFLLDMTQEETARALGMHIGAVKSNTARGLQSLQTILNGA